MQDWRDQARKNGLEVEETGACQLCGAALERGVAECVELSGAATHGLPHDEGVRTGALFLSVDAHALQHTEIHGRWNDHFHLTRLHLILREGVRWSYRLSMRRIRYHVASTHATP